MKTLSISLSLATLVAPLAAHADDAAEAVEVTAAPPIAAAPASGVDPDVTARFTSADDLLARGDLPGALAAVLVVYESPDPFSLAQRTRAAPDAAARLTQIGTRARSQGDLVLAARAFDARWTITHQKDPDLARALVAWSEREPSPGRALYLARRARLADPDLAAAAARDDELSHNQRAWTGRLIVLAGVAAFCAGIYADTSGEDTIATALYVAGPVLTTGGLLWEFSGTPSHTPMSPGELPALPER